MIIETWTVARRNKISCYLFWLPRYLSIITTGRAGEIYQKVVYSITREPRSLGLQAVLPVTSLLHDCCLSSAPVDPFLRRSEWSWQSCCRLAGLSKSVDSYARRIVNCVDFGSLRGLVRRHSSTWWLPLTDSYSVHRCVSCTAARRCADSRVPCAACSASCQAVPQGTAQPTQAVSSCQWLRWSSLDVSVGAQRRASTPLPSVAVAIAPCTARTTVSCDECSLTGDASSQSLPPFPSLAYDSLLSLSRLQFASFSAQINHSCRLCKCHEVHSGLLT